MTDVAVITGAGRGIGRAASIALAARGLDVVLLGRTASDLERVAERIEADHRVRALPIVCDVANASAVDAVSGTVRKQLGPPRVVVNNAGVVERALVEDMTEDAWDRVVDANLKGTFLVTRAFLREMKERARGRIVHVASISSTLGTPRLSAYCASKWGVVGFMKSLAEELRGTGVQTMAILPGSVDTEMLRGSGFAPQMTAEDVASAIVYLALDAPDAMHGSAVEAFGP